MVGSKSKSLNLRSSECDGSVRFDVKIIQEILNAIIWSVVISPRYFNLQSNIRNNYWARSSEDNSATLFVLINPKNEFI